VSQSNETTLFDQSLLLCDNYFLKLAETETSNSDPPSSEPGMV
jgi:hypothetical protein